MFCIDQVQHALMSVGMKPPIEADFVVSFIFWRAWRALCCIQPPLEHALHRPLCHYPLSLCFQNSLRKSARIETCFCEVLSGNRTLTDASQVVKGVAQIPNVVRTLETGETTRWMEIRMKWNFSLGSLTSLSRNCEWECFSNVACLPAMHWLIQPIRLPDADSGQDQDPSSETIVAIHECTRFQGCDQNQKNKFGLAGLCPTPSHLFRVGNMVLLNKPNFHKSCLKIPSISEDNNSPAC